MTWSLNKIFNHRVFNSYSFLALMLLGGCAMSADIEYNWEWPADRAIEERRLIHIKNIKKKSSGFFGINKSPSLVSNFPDPYIIGGITINVDSKIKTETVQVTAPLLEIEGIKAGSLAMLGIVENNICVCIVPIDNENVDLNDINCH